MKPTSSAATTTLRKAKATGASLCAHHARARVRLLLLPLFPHRCLATQHRAAGPTESKRRAVTPLNDDGRVPWSRLSTGEKAGRAAQQTFHFGMVAVGVVLTGGVGYFLLQDVFSAESQTAYFNRAVNRIKNDPRCLELLGDGRKITAYGKENSYSWRRNRPIASSKSKDAQGREHLRIQFYIGGPKGTGSVALHLVRRGGQDEYEYKVFYVDVRGHERIYLENADAASSSATKGLAKSFRLFGVNWN